MCLAGLVYKGPTAQPSNKGQCNHSPAAGRIELPLQLHAEKSFSSHSRRRKEVNCSSTTADISKRLSQQEVWMQPASLDSYRRTSRNQHSASAEEIMTGVRAPATAAQPSPTHSTQYDQEQQGNLGHKGVQTRTL